MKKIEYYLDCSSPWTYLSFRGILELRKNKEFEIVWKPILVGGIFNSTNPSVYESRKNPVKEKLEYSQKDMDDWAKQRNIEFNWPKIFPINSVKSMRGVFYFIDKNESIEEYEQKSIEYYNQAKLDFTKEVELLDSLNSNNLISQTNYLYRLDALNMLMEKHKKLKNIKFLDKYLC